MHYYYPQHNYGPPAGYAYSAPAPRAAQTQIARFDNPPLRGHSGGNVLLSIPPNYDPRRPSVMLLYFHGHGGGPEHTLREQRMVEQLNASGLNAVLVAPRTGSRSEPGQFNTPGYTARFLEEAAHHLARLQTGGAYSAQALDNFRRMPIVPMSYSGGYLGVGAVLADSMRDPALGRRVAGAMIFDGMYNGHMPTFHRFAQQPHRPFFVSTYIPHGQVEANNLTFQRNARGNITISPVHPAGARPGSSQQAISQHYTHLMQTGHVRAAFAAIPNFMAASRGATYAEAPRPYAAQRYYS